MWSEPILDHGRTSDMTFRLRRILVFVAALLAVVGVALFGAGRQPTPVSAAPSVDAELTALADEFSAGDSRAVVQRLERRVARRSDDSALHSALGLGYQQLFRETANPAWLSRARGAFDDARALGGADDALTLLGLAQLSATQHRFAEAELYARQALRAAPDNVAALGALGDALLELGRYEDAFAANDRAAGQGPSVGAYARVARARELLGRSVAALEAMEFAIEAGSGIPEQKAWALSRHGGLLLDIRRVEAARRAFEQALRLQPDFPHAEAGLAKVVAARGQRVAAARRFEQLLRRVPSAEYATELGDLYLSMGREGAAARAYDRARRFERALARNGVRTMLASASLDLDLGVHLRSALVRARQAYREAPNVETEAVLAWALARNGQCVEARQFSRRALALGTRDASFLFHRGMIERCLGSSSAASWFAAALRVDPAFSPRWAPVAERLARAATKGATGTR
jgi:tetratricopeptide (TPR) repeat protein